MQQVRKHPPPGHSAVCDLCGASGLKWRVDSAGNWRLYEKTRIEGNRKKLHECTAPSEDDFEDLT